MTVGRAAPTSLQRSLTRPLRRQRVTIAAGQKLSDTNGEGDEQAHAARRWAKELDPQRNPLRNA
jgi:hypothetical protein